MHNFILNQKNVMLNVFKFKILLVVLLNLHILHYIILHNCILLLLLNLQILHDFIKAECITFEKNYQNAFKNSFSWSINNIFPKIVPYQHH